MWLPVLGQNRSRQCDVVLRIGREPRQQLFIVEVQQRGVKPDINTFGGWLRKMEEVGANGLICVSEAGFPRSIIEDVALRVGPKVKLMTLERNADSSNIGPFYIVPELVRSSYKIRFLELKGLEPFEPECDRTVSINMDGRILSNTGNPADAQTVDSIAEQCVREKDPHASLPKAVIGQPINVDYTLTTSDTLQLWLHAREGIFRLRIFSIRVQVRRVDKIEPMIYSKWTYSQEFHGSSLAWIASASFEIDTHLAEMSLIFTPDKNGFLQPSMTLKTYPKP